MVRGGHTQRGNVTSSLKFYSTCKCNWLNEVVHCKNLCVGLCSPNAVAFSIYYSVFTFSWPRFESESLRNGGMLILRIYFAVDGMPIEMYGESWIAGLLTSDNVMLYMAGFGTTQGI